MNINQLFVSELHMWSNVVYARFFGSSLGKVQFRIMCSNYTNGHRENRQTRGLKHLLCVCMHYDSCIVIHMATSAEGASLPVVVLGAGWALRRHTKMRGLVSGSNTEEGLATGVTFGFPSPRAGPANNSRRISAVIRWWLWIFNSARSCSRWSLVTACLYLWAKVNRHWCQITGRGPRTDFIWRKCFTTASMTGCGNAYRLLSNTCKNTLVGPVYLSDANLIIHTAECSCRSYRHDAKIIDGVRNFIQQNNHLKTYRWDVFLN